MKRLRPVPLTLKARVTLTYDPDRRGTVLAVGEEVSEVRWDDGPVLHTINEFLRVLKGDSYA